MTVGTDAYTGSRPTWYAIHVCLFVHLLI